MAAEKVPEEAAARQRGVYGISVAADLAGTGTQNLRLYERRGLLEPARSAGGTRLYSADDVDRLQRIISLLADGLNLAGVAMVLDLQDDNARLRSRQARRPAPRRPSDPVTGESNPGEE
ncbi:MAG: MerR family transcriptional regulator [Propionibacteriaceae bacterium]